MEKLNGIMLRIAVSGANGRMGCELIKAINQLDNVILGAALVRKNSKLCGMDVGELVGLNKCGILLHDDLIDVKDDFDVLIDFTNPDATLKYLDFCCNYNKDIIIGTTGFTDEQNNFIRNLICHIGIVISSNFSIGISVILKVLEYVSSIIGRRSDIDIIDIHHRNKIDIPSGTSLSMGQVIANTIGYRLIKDSAGFCNVNNNIKRDKNCIMLHSIRSGDVIGQHTSMFVNDGESIEITHKSYNRSIYVDGAIRAALWLHKYRKIGIFNMCDVLEL